MSARPKCGACESDRRDELDLSLARGVAISIVAQTHALPVETVVWHCDRHLRGIPKKTGASAHELVDDLQYVKTRAENVLQTALADGKITVALTAIREMRETIMSLAKLTHAEQALDPSYYLPLYAEVKRKILAAVEDNPTVRDRIIAALAAPNGKSNE